MKQGQMGIGQACPGLAAVKSRRLHDFHRKLRSVIPADPETPLVFFQSKGGSANKRAGHRDGNRTAADEDISPFGRAGPSPTAQDFIFNPQPEALQFRYYPAQLIT
jgi:hypothetical protein